MSREHTFTPYLGICIKCGEDKESVGDIDCKWLGEPIRPTLIEIMDKMIEIKDMIKEE